MRNNRSILIVVLAILVLGFTGIAASVAEEFCNPECKPGLIFIETSHSGIPICPPPSPPPPPLPDKPGRLEIIKFYDVNNDGEMNDGEAILAGDGAEDTCFRDCVWEFRLWNDEYGPIDLEAGEIVTLPPGVYYIEELPFVPCNNPDGNNMYCRWKVTHENPVQTRIDSCTKTTHYFGNVCLCCENGEGETCDGHTPGYWQGPNGEAEFDWLFPGIPLSDLELLHLVDNDLNDFDPGTYDDLEAWIVPSGAGGQLQMAYKLSRHLAAMVLNVLAEYVSEDCMVNKDGGEAISIGDLIDEANDALERVLEGPPPLPTKEELESLKDLLDDANSNREGIWATGGGDGCSIPTPCSLGEACQKCGCPIFVTD